MIYVVSSCTSAEFILNKTEQLVRLNSSYYLVDMISLFFLVSYAVQEQFADLSSVK